MKTIRATLQEEIRKHGYSEKVKVGLDREGLMVTMHIECVVSLKRKHSP